MLNEVQGALIEPENSGASWASGFWTSDEVIGEMNDHQREFLLATLCLMTPATLVTIPNVLRHPLPQDWIITYDVQWHTSANVWKELPRSDSFEVDLMLTNWDYETQPQPDWSSDGDQATLTMQVMPAANDNGVLEIIYVACSATLSNSGIAFDVPDEFTPAIKWGVISNMLSKVGRGIDPQRAAYAQQRWLEGIEAAKVMLRGYI
jgi:hypothetical protein